MTRAGVSAKIACRRNSISKPKMETETRTEPTRPDFPYGRVVVTGGSGFLGRFVVEKLKDYPHIEVFVPRSREYNLIEGDDVERLLADTKPDMVIHLAGVVGGIGSNR